MLVNAHLDGGVEGYQLRRVASIVVSNTKNITITIYCAMPLMTGTGYSGNGGVVGIWQPLDS